MDFDSKPAIEGEQGPEAIALITASTEAVMRQALVVMKAYRGVIVQTIADIDAGMLRAGAYRR